MELLYIFLWIFISVHLVTQVFCDLKFNEGNGLSSPLFRTGISDFSSHEVVKPVIYKGKQRLLSAFDKDGYHDNIVMQIDSGHRNFTFNLKRNRHLFAKNYIEKTYTEGNNYRIEKPHYKKLQKHCFYHGEIKGVPHSKVAVSTCDGISGYVIDGKDAYHIEPAFDIDESSHRIFKDAHSIGTPHKCGAHKFGHSTRLNETREIEHKNAVLHRMRRSIRPPYDSNINTRYLEMYVVNDFRTYDSHGRDLQRQIRHTQTIANIVSQLYRPFNIYIVLVGIENWTVQDLCSITNEADGTLENFLHYRKNRINVQHPNDNAQLITGTTFKDGVVGKALKGTICTHQYSGGVNQNLPKAGQTATTIAHELGHNFGMDHDNYTMCQCKEDKCIMAATSGGSNTHWSSCSMAALQEAFEMGMDYCLRNKPEQLPDGPVCGNSFTEDGEECDCGLPEDCHTKCCNATTCKLTTGSSCATGGCCDLNTCQPKEAATLCRAAAGECDLPEFCRGNEPDCPNDVYLQNGVECHGGQSYCYRGQCKTHTGQCKLLWGSTGRVSDPVCFKHLNTNGSKYGNCGYNWTTGRYEPCLRDDVMCGLLHCVHQNEKLMFWKDNLAHATPATFLTIGVNTYICRGVLLDVGLDMPDPGMVPEGAKCDNRKICVDHKCTPLSHLSIHSCPASCSDNGVCNSRGHCHCDENYGGPLCDTSGNGGSIDSGPIKISDSKGLLVGLLVFFLLIVPLIGIAVFVGYRFRVQIIAWLREQVAKKSKSSSRPNRPSRPPPKRDPNLLEGGHQHDGVKYQNEPPPYPGSVTFNNNRGHNQKKSAVNGQHTRSKISNPILTGSTHTDSQTQVHKSPAANKKPPPNVPPKRPQKPVVTVDSDAPPPYTGTTTEKVPLPEAKPRFGQIFKIPSFSRNSADKPASNNPKVEAKMDEDVSTANVVKKRELNREISSPVLISTTDRRSMHLVKLENVKVNAAPVAGAATEEDSGPAPRIPPHVSLNRSESDNRHKNRPLPPRPLSMPESECGDEIEPSVTDARKSFGGVPPPPVKAPQRPPPPAAAKPNIDKMRQNMEEELARIDGIQLKFLDDGKSSDSDAASSPFLQKKNIKPKPKPNVSKPGLDTKVKKPTVPKKSLPASKAGSDSPKTKQWGTVEKPIFNPKDRPGQSKVSKPDASKSNNSTKSSVSDKKQNPGMRKISTDSLDDDPDSGAANVTGLAKMFEGQKKPLLVGENKKIAKTQSHGDTKAPMTPPKPRPGAKKVRSVDV